MALSTFTVVQTAPLSSFRTFSSTQTETVLFKYKPPFLLGYPQSACNLCFVFCVYEFAYSSHIIKWNLKWFVLLHLTYLIQHIFMVQPWYRMYQNLVPLCDWIISYCMYMPHFVIHSPVDGHLVVSTRWILKIMLLWMLIYKLSVWVPALQFFGVYIRLA